MLAAIGIEPDQAYHASLACFHAPGARIGRDQLDACAAMARDHVRLAKPERLILLGDAPARALLGEPLARARGRLHKVEGVRTIATFNPRWLLQRPSDKALAWRDLLLLMSEND
jgi:DNA polymerase